MQASIIIRTYNEAQHLPQLLESISRQSLPSSEYELIVVDSGSTDATLEIVAAHPVQVVHIRKETFSFGRSLNIGCDAATGRALVFISGHCYPVEHDWLERLIAPLDEDNIAYSYGRQVGNEHSRFSERQLFRKYFPEKSRIPQDGFFCNNANSAMLREVWQTQRFNEDLTGLEDMEMAQRLVDTGLKVAYVAEAPVYHLHEESWTKVRIRYEREAIALQKIMPQVHVSLWDFLRYWACATSLDLRAATGSGQLRQVFSEVLMFRLMQYWGTYRGNHEHRKLSHSAKEEYFYPA